MYLPCVKVRQSKCVTAGGKEMNTMAAAKSKTYDLVTLTQKSMGYFRVISSTQIPSKY